MSSISPELKFSEMDISMFIVYVSHTTSTYCQAQVQIHLRPNSGPFKAILFIPIPIQNTIFSLHHKPQISFHCNCPPNVCCSPPGPVKETSRAYILGLTRWGPSGGWWSWSELFDYSLSMNKACITCE